VTAAPVWARRSSPATHQAAMDGFAVLAATTFGTTPDQPKHSEHRERSLPHQYGHVMPPGRMRDHGGKCPNPEADPITIEAPVFPWHNVRRIGEDLVAGEMVLTEGVVISPWDQGALLAAGVTRVK